MKTSSQPSQLTQPSQLSQLSQPTQPSKPTKLTRFEDIIAWQEARASQTVASPQSDSHK